MRSYFPGILTLCLSLFAALPAVAQQKLTVVDIIAAHLASIGPRAKLSETRSRVILGTSEFAILPKTSGGARGKVLLISEGTKMMLAASFDVAAYPMEKISVVDEKASIGTLPAGNRSPLGNFLYAHPAILRDGLLGGSLSSVWPLINVGGSQRLTLAGKKKIDGRPAYVLDYLPAGGSDVDIKIYFDAETFRHVRTEYSQTLSAAQGSTPNASVHQLESRHQLTEDFGDFREEGGLTLPHTCSMRLTILGAGGTSEFEWKFRFDRFEYNQPLDAGTFKDEE